mgnify:CR=1 FL=1|jgi:hypothetical protein
MHGQSGGLACRQRRIQAFVQAFEQTLGDGQLLRMQIGHLRAKRVLDALPSAHPLDGPVDVVRRRDHGQRRKAGAEAAHGGSEQLGDQRQPLRRDLGEHLRHGGGVPHRDEAPDHPVRLDRIPRVGAEAQTASGQHRLPPEFVSGEHDVVVEHCGYSHDAPGRIPPGADQPRSAPLPAMMAR